MNCIGTVNVLASTAKQNEYINSMETGMFCVLGEISDFRVAWTCDLFYINKGIWEKFEFGRKN